MRPRNSCGQFGIGFDFEAGRVELPMRGELDALSVPILAGVLDALVERGTQLVTIDLSGLRFCSVAGLRAPAGFAARLSRVDRAELHSNECRPVRETFATIVSASP